MIFTRHLEHFYCQVNSGFEFVGCIFKCISWVSRWHSKGKPWDFLKKRDLFIYTMIVSKSLYISYICVCYIHSQLKLEMNIITLGLCMEWHLRPSLENRESPSLAGGWVHVCQNTRNERSVLLQFNFFCLYFQGPRAVRLLPSRYERLPHARRRRRAHRRPRPVYVAWDSLRLQHLWQLPGEGQDQILRPCSGEGISCRQIQLPWWVSFTFPLIVSLYLSFAQLWRQSLVQIYLD